MLINKSIISILCLLFIFSACNKKKTYNFYDDSLLLDSISIDFDINNLDSTINLFCDINNLSNKNILIPMTYWKYMGKAFPGHVGLNNPVNPYIINTITYTTLGDDFDGGMFPEMYWKTKFNRWPYFLAVPAKNARTLEITIPQKFYTPQDTLANIFNKLAIYNFSTKLSIISENNIEQLLEDKSINDIITQENNVILKISEQSRLNYKKAESDKYIDSSACLSLNELANNKKEITFHLDLASEDIIINQIKTNDFSWVKFKDSKTLETILKLLDYDLNKIKWKIKLCNNTNHKIYQNNSSFCTKLAYLFDYLILNYDSTDYNFYECKNRIYKNCSLGKNLQKYGSDKTLALKKQDYKIIKKYYMKWWQKNKNKSWSDLRILYQKGETPLKYTVYCWE